LLFKFGLDGCEKAKPNLKAVLTRDMTANR